MSALARVLGQRAGSSSFANFSRSSFPAGLNYGNKEHAMVRLSRIWKLYITYTVALIVCMTLAGFFLDFQVKRQLEDHLTGRRPGDRPPGRRPSAGPSQPRGNVGAVLPRLPRSGRLAVDDRRCQRRRARRLPRSGDPHGQPSASKRNRARRWTGATARPCA